MSDLKLCSLLFFAFIRFWSSYLYFCKVDILSCSSINCLAYWFWISIWFSLNLLISNFRFIIMSYRLWFWLISISLLRSPIELLFWFVDSYCVPLFFFLDLTMYRYKLEDWFLGFNYRGTCNLWVIL